MDTNYSLSDIAAMTNKDGFLGGGAGTLIILFLIIMMLGGGGIGWNRGGNYDATQQEILFGQRFSSLDNKIDRLANGLADLGYAQQGAMNNMQTVLGGAIGTEGRNIQMQLAESTCKIENAVHAEGEATRNLIQQNTVQQLRERVAALEADSRMCGVVRYPMQMAYSAGGSPFCNYNNGCGCNGGNI